MKRIVFVILFLLWTSLSFAANTFTLTTYYPAPAGVYDSMTTRVLTVKEKISFPGVTVGGGEERADIDPARVRSGEMLYEAAAEPFSCSAWGHASCSKTTAGSLTCPEGSQKRLTGVFMDNGVSNLPGHGTFFIFWSVCASE